MAIDFGDIASRYASARLDQATQPFTDPEAYLNNRMMQNYGVDLGGNVKPKSTTITNNDDGTQTVTEKHEVTPTPQAAPTYGGPGIGEGAYQIPVAQPAPQAMPQAMPAAAPAPQAAPVANVDAQAIDEQRRRQLELAQLQQAQAAQQMPPATPVAPQPMPDQTAAETQRLAAQNAAAAPVAPQALPAQAAVNEVNATQLPQATRGVQVAGGAPGTGLTPTATTVLNPDEQHQQLIIDAHNEKDPARRQQMLGRLLQDEGVSKENKMMANEILARDYLDVKKTREAEKKVANLKDTDIARYMKDKSVEGSYVKAILFARLGLNDLARQEQEKINPSVAMGSEIGADGQRYSVVRNKEGFITKAFDTTGKEADDATVASLSANAMATKGNIGHSGATRVRDVAGNEWSVVPTTRGSQFYDNTGKPGVPTGKTVPITAGSDVDLQRQIAIAKTQVRVEGLKAEDRIKAIERVNAERIKEGLEPLSPAEIGFNDKGESIVSGRVGAGGAAAQPAGGAVGTDLSPDLQKKIVSANRTNDQQQALYDESVRAGRPGRTAGNMPIAQPGTSRHEAGSAIDMPKNLTRAERAELAQKGYYQPEGTDSVHWERLPGAATAGAPAAAPTSVAQVQREREQAQQVGTAEQKEYVQHKNTVQDASDAGRKVAQITRAQTSDLMNDPAIIGIMNGSGTQNAAAGKLLREMVSGAYSGDGDNGKRLADDIRGLSIPQPQKDALSRYAQMNTSINSATLKSNVGAGSVSNAEQTMNQRANMTNIGDLTPFAALNGLGRRQFTGDLAQEKANMINTGQYKTRAEFERAWGQVEEQRVKQYESIYKGRLDLIKPFAEAATKNPNDTVAQQRYRDAAIHAFRVYPNPDYDTASGKWTYKTKESKMAAMAAAAGER